MSKTTTVKPVVAQFQRYPDLTGKRQAEGGRRLIDGVPAGTLEAPLVSILTVCWNSDTTIEQTIQSVRAQSYSNIEHIIVDGGSTDDTLDIVRRNEDAIAYYLSEPDGGLYVAMNKALQLAQGDYILILNSDDWYVPDCVEALLAAKRETRADFVSGMANYVDAEGKFLRLQRSFSFDGNTLFMMPLRHETMLVSREIYQRVGLFDTAYRVIADRVFTTRLYEVGYTHHAIQRPLINFRVTGVSMTNLEAVRAERYTVIKTNFPFLEDEDALRLAHLEQLEPEVLQVMIERYAHPRLSHAAADMVRDRQSRKVKKWMVLDTGAMRAVGAERRLPSRWPRRDRMLRVATFVTSDHGGAGIGTQRRVEALRKAGVDARIYCLFRNTPYAHVSALTADILGAESMPRPELQKVWRARSVVTTKDEKGLTARELFSKTGSVIDFRNHRQVFDEADVIHLHWPIGMLDYAHFGESLGDKPVVYTLADMASFTGGCHYSEGCQAYARECNRCPLLAGADSAHEHWRVKRDAYAQIRDLQIVSPSGWLATRARESSLWGDRPVHLIPNALPVTEFKPTNKLVARMSLGLPLNKMLILFGADNVGNLRKGGDLLAASIKRLIARGHDHNVEGVYFGANAVDFGIPMHGMGRIKNLERLSLIYAAADVFASPSREDSGPMTVAEAMLSGTPVVAFDIGNAPEIVVHKDTGYIARQEDVEDFTNGLAWALAAPRSPDAILRGNRACLAARAYNNPETAARRHIELYNDMLEAAERCSAS